MDCGTPASFYSVTLLECLKVNKLWFSTNLSTMLTSSLVKPYLLWRFAVASHMLTFPYTTVPPSLWPNDFHYININVHQMSSIIGSAEVPWTSNDTMKWSIALNRPTSTMSQPEASLIKERHTCISVVRRPLRFIASIVWHQTSYNLSRYNAWCIDIRLPWFFKLFYNIIINGLINIIKKWTIFLWIDI